MIAQRKKKMRGKSETVLKTLEILDKEIPVVEKALFTSLVEDNKKMEERMTALEKKVTDVEKKVDTVISDNQLIKNQLTSTQDMLEQLNKSIQANIDIHKNRLKLVSSVLQNKWFWMLAILTLLIIAGVDIAQLAGIVRMESITQK